MPKSRTRKPKSRSTSPADRRQRRIDGLIDELADDYAAWAVGGAEADPPSDAVDSDLEAFARGQLETVKSFYVLLGGAGDRPTPGLRIDPAGVPDALDAMLDTDDLDDLRYYIGTLIDWVSFLEETERWEGSAADLEAVTEFLDAEAEAAGGIVDLGPEGESLPRREPTEEEALEFATSSPFVRHARALLDWVGDGRAVAADGALTPSEATEAAALIGDGAADPARRLARFWTSLRNAELIEIDDVAADDDSGSTAHLGEDAPRLGTGDAFGRLEAQFLATEFIITTCDATGHHPDSQRAAVVEAMATILSRAVLEDPVPLSAVENLAVDAPEGTDPAKLQTVSVLLLDELRELAALGLVDLREGLVDVPAAALDAVYDAFEAPDGDEDWEDDA